MCVCVCVCVYAGLNNIFQYFCSYLYVLEFRYISLYCSFTIYFYLARYIYTYQASVKHLYTF